MLRAAVFLPRMMDVSVERGRVVVGSVQVNLRCGSELTYGANYATWPFETGSVNQLRSEHVLEYLTGPERIAFMEECGRVLRVGGSLLLTFFYATSRQASSDPMFQWPPLTEFSFDYFNRSWRELNKCDYPITCDFDFTYKCDLDTSLLARNNEFQHFTTKHYNQSVIKMHGLMTKRS